MAEAEKIYRQILKVQPNHFASLHLLGVIYHQRGYHAKAVRQIDFALKVNPNAASAHCNRGLALHKLKRLDEALASYDKALALKPDYAEAFNNRGLVLQELERLDEALASYDKALALKPDHAGTFNDRGLVLQELKRLDEALASYHKALALKPDYAEALNNRGNALQELKRLDEALASYDRALALKPDYAEAFYNRGLALQELKWLEEALASYDKALALKPDYAEALINCGLALQTLKRPDEALACYHKVLALKPNSADDFINRGKALQELKRTDEMIAAYRQAIILNPHFAAAHSTLGVALRQLGHLSEARAAFEEAVRLAPRNTQYRFILSDMTHFVAGDPHLAAMEELARDGTSLSANDRIELHFALAKAYEDLGRHAEAFTQWLDGNALKRRQITYDEATTLGLLDHVRTAFTPGLIRKWQNIGNSSPVPVFIVGMARSGSTLVEQILASHPQVFGGGELTSFDSAVQGIRTTPGGPATFPELVSGMAGEDYRDLGTRYLAEIERLAPGATHITDKMPMNFIYAGLIHLALPNAPIIHTVRDPIDTCLSCFSKLFGGALNHSYDLAELGRYYRHYQALMAHWHRVLPPGRILDVSYEDVVADLEGQARRIVAHCGLDWDPRCLAFHQTQRSVGTASAAQVRQPIYNSAVGRWRVYEEFLEFTACGAQNCKQFRSKSRGYKRQQFRLSTKISRMQPDKQAAGHFGSAHHWAAAFTKKWPHASTGVTLPRALSNGPRCSS